MTLKTNKDNFKIVEFQHYIREIEEHDFSSVLDLIIETSLERIEDMDFSIFSIVTDRQTYIFSGYEILEYCVDENDGFIKITLVK